MRVLLCTGIKGFRQVTGHVWLDGEVLKFDGDAKLLEAEIRDGGFKVVLGKRRYTLDDGEEFLRALPYAINGSRVWAELQE